MWIQISSGKGPDECELAVSLFLQSYSHECKKNKVRITILDAVPGHISGNFKSVLLSLEAPEKPEEKVSWLHQKPKDGNDQLSSGTVLWICKSPYRPNHKRKNWFIRIEVLTSPDLLDFSEKDVTFETTRSAGPGGQNVNKVESAVRAIHIPTGIMVKASEERSQYMNKRLALSRLYHLIQEKNNESIKNHERKLWMHHNTLERGNPIRVYEDQAFKRKQLYTIKERNQ
jgi:peptide chain release factor